VFTVFDNVQNKEVSSDLQTTVLPNIPKIPEPMIPPLLFAGTAGLTLPPFAIIYIKHIKKYRIKFIRFLNERGKR